MEEHRRVADYFLICGLPPDPENQSVLNESSLEVNLKPSHNQVASFTRGTFPSKGVLCA